MTWLLLGVVVLGMFFLDWKASKALALQREAVELLRQLRDATNRAEKDRLDHEAAALKRAAGGGAPPLPR